MVGVFAASLNGFLFCLCVTCKTTKCRVFFLYFDFAVEIVVCLFFELLSLCKSQTNSTATSGEAILWVTCTFGLLSIFCFIFIFFFVFPICFEMLKMCVARGEHYVAISLARHNKSSIYRQLCRATVVVLLSKLIYIKPWTILIHRHDDSSFCCCFGCNGEPNVMPHFHLVLCSIYNWVMWLSNNLVIYQRAEATNSGKLYISWY